MHGTTVKIIKEINIITWSQFFVRLRLCSPLLFIGAHSQCFSRPVNSHTFLTSNCLKDPSVSVPLADPGELRLMIQHDRPTSSYSPSSNFYTVLCTQLTYLLTPWCRDLLEKLTGLQLVKKFSAFYGTRRFIAAFTSFRHLSLSWASPIQSTCPQPTSWRSINIIHPSTPRSPQRSLSLRFPHQDSRPPLLPHTNHMTSPSHSSRFYHPHNIGCSYYNNKF